MESSRSIHGIFVHFEILYDCQGASQRAIILGTGGMFAEFSWRIIGEFEEFSWSFSWLPIIALNTSSQSWPGLCLSWDLHAPTFKK